MVVIGLFRTETKMETEWKKVKLGDIATFSNGINFGKESYAKGVKLITVSDFGDRYFPEYNELVEVDEKVLRPTDYIQNGDVVFVRSNGNKELVGRCMLIENPAKPVTYSGFCIRARLNNINENNPRFFTYYFKSRTFRRAMSNTAVGANIQNLNQGLLSNHELLLPPLATQQKIAGILSAYDDLIENNRKQIKLLEEAAQKLYKEWFVKLNFPCHENVKIVDGVPEGWKNVELNTVLSKITTRLNPRKNFVLGKGYNYYVTIKNMGDNNIYLNDKCDKVNDEAPEKINKRSDLQTGDILFSGIGTIGRVYLVSIPTDNWNVSESVFTFRPNEFISKEFLYLLLLSDDMQAYCDLNAHGTAQRGIRMADLKAYKFALPDSNLITRFTKIIAPYISKAQCLKSQTVKLQSARNKLLPKLMNGDFEK